MAESQDPTAPIILVAGIKESGKTTFVNNFFGLSSNEDSPANDVKFALKGGRGMVLIEINEESVQELKDDNDDTKPDLLIYCVSVFQFNKGNHVIMESLQENYGKDIWKRCKLIFTLSNCAQEFWLSKSKNESEAYKRYQDHLNLYARLFEEELQKLDVDDVIVRTTFADESTQGKYKIQALLAGKDVSDQVVAVPSSTHNNSGGWKKDIHNNIENEDVFYFAQGDCTVLFESTIKNCKELAELYTGTLKQLKTNPGLSATLGGAIGGAIVGSPLGPLGVAVGAFAGSLIGWWKGPPKN